MTTANTNIITCPTCNGTRWKNDVELCQVCRGAGVIPVMAKEIATAGQIEKENCSQAPGQGYQTA